jgi:ribose 1,5-bisphosphate isomerase
MDSKREFEKISRDIRNVKIQGARNIAKAALNAYFIISGKSSKKKLLSLRPTEPMMKNILDMAEKGISKEKILSHFSEAQEKINRQVFSIIKNGDTIFTHCHSTNVVNSLIYAKKHGKKFQVYNTETRPLFQGRKTARELRKAGIKVTMFIDSAAAIAIGKQNKKDKVYATKVFLGADALLKKGIINKIGSEVIGIIAKYNKIPLYIIADSWKFTKSNIPIEQRKLNEIWDLAPKGIKIKNPAFEFVKKEYIKGIITEHGLMGYDKFVRKIS